MPRKIVNEESLRSVVRRLLERKTSFAAGELAAELGTSRQGIQPHLQRLLEDGTIARVGQGRATAYRRAEPVWRSWEFPLRDMEEDRVWSQVTEDAMPLTAALGVDADRIATFAATELLNNARDHSRGSHVIVRVRLVTGIFSFQIEDDGEGVFEHIRRERGLGSEVEALQDLTKGKVTTAPEHHTGMGIFFTSRALDRFVLESDSLRWTVDNRVGDTAWGSISPRRGTLAHCEIAVQPQRQLKDVFDKYSNEDMAFSKTQTWVKLFESGLSFISRSEAKRLLVDLEKFEDVTLDFKDVTEIGQGFADEVFRVWSLKHPGVRLHAINTVPPVEAMIRMAKAPLDRGSR